MDEEREVIAAYIAMRAKFPDLCLIVAPRQIDRAGDVESALQKAGLTSVRRSAMKQENSKQDFFKQDAAIKVLILDTMGELANIYAIASFAFVGNSFPPVIKGGGQNLLQPLAHGKPVLFGPYTATTRAEVALVLESDVGFQVTNGIELAEKGLMLLKNAPLCAEISARATALIAANQGVSRRYAEAVAEMAYEKK